MQFIEGIMQLWVSNGFDKEHNIIITLAVTSLELLVKGATANHEHLFHGAKQLLVVL